jgi:hypothetical protein
MRFAIGPLHHTHLRFASMHVVPLPHAFGTGEENAFAFLPRREAMGEGDHFAQRNGGLPRRSCAVREPVFARLRELRRGSLRCCAAKTGEGDAGTFFAQRDF